MQSVPNPLPCPLCDGRSTAPFHQDRKRTYLQCDTCRLVFVPGCYFLSPQEERACYDQHENRPDDPAYRAFLGRLFLPLQKRLAPGAHGLDFGSGPGPTLSLMFAEAGFPMRIYDPFYAPQEEVWQNSYDFITATEVLEHLHQPGWELERLWHRLRPGGWLGLMTKRVLTPAAFANWHYKQDPTHVVFFSEQTFVWLADRWKAELEVLGPDVVLLRKPEQHRREPPNTISASQRTHPE